MKVFKLTDQKYQTRNQTQWGINVTHYTSGAGELCSPGWLHYYEHPLLAVLLNPIHAGIQNPVLWEALAAGDTLRDCGLKAGCTELTTLRRIELPEVTLEQRIRFGILCALEVYKHTDFVSWANDGLSGKDRSKAAAARAAAAAATAADAAAAAEWAEWAAARAAEPLDLIALAKKACFTN